MGCETECRKMKRAASMPSTPTAVHRGCERSVRRSVTMPRCCCCCCSGGGDEAVACAREENDDDSIRNNGVSQIAASV